jgi:hypothetical protein
MALCGTILGGGLTLLRRFVLTWPLGLTACPGFSSLLCPAGVVVPAVTVEVRDADSDAPAAVGAVATARSDAFVDTLRVLDKSRLMTQLADTGTYHIEVRKAGYRTWTAESVRVERRQGACPRLRTVRLHAVLEREP